MENKTLLFELIESTAVSLGASRARVIGADLIQTDAIFREMCVSNACGMYGKCWMCPPDVGEINALMSEIREYDYALVYQTVTPLEDSFDYEGMVRAKKNAYVLARAVREAFDDLTVRKTLHLGAGGCGGCEVCSKEKSEPCRHTGLAMPSLEAYGIHVLRLAESAGMRYTNGVNTVTYFGTVLFCL